MKKYFILILTIILFTGCNENKFFKVMDKYNYSYFKDTEHASKNNIYYANIDDIEIRYEYTNSMSSAKIIFENLKDSTKIYTGDKTNETFINKNKYFSVLTLDKYIVIKRDWNKIYYIIGNSENKKKIDKIIKDF